MTETMLKIIGATFNYLYWKRYRSEQIDKHGRDCFEGLPRAPLSEAGQLVFDAAEGLLREQRPCRLCKKGNEQEYIEPHPKGGYVHWDCRTDQLMP